MPFQSPLHPTVCVPLPGMMLGAPRPLLPVLSGCCQSYLDEPTLVLFSLSSSPRCLSLLAHPAAGGSKCVYCLSLVLCVASLLWVGCAKEHLCSMGKSSHSCSQGAGKGQTGQSPVLSRRNGWHKGIPALPSCPSLVQGTLSAV